MKRVLKTIKEGFFLDFCNSSGSGHVTKRIGGLPALRYRKTPSGRREKPGKTDKDPGEAKKDGALSLVATRQAIMCQSLRPSCDNNVQINGKDGNGGQRGGP